MTRTDKDQTVSAVLPSFYTPAEERLNILTHGLGLLLSVIGLVLLVIRASALGTAMHVTSFTIFGVSLITLYGASTIYHSAKNPDTRTRLRTLDHAAIYVLIAGSYTPFTLTVLDGVIGWSLFAAAWTMAALGIVMKLFFTGRFNLFSTLMYVFMGWLIIFAIKPLLAALPGEGTIWLFAGGISYTLGAVSYSIKKLPFGHAVFHLFVLAGSICHFVVVYNYILQPA
jgi:hemolysin III